jgi:NCS1 family nucleobase:cation symporter-1
MLGNLGPIAVNINDFARYARSTIMIFGQIFVSPLSFMLMAFMGMSIAGAASDLCGESTWVPLTAMAHWSGSFGARAASAFASLSFVLAQLGPNISANGVSASNDLNAMFPSVSPPHALYTISTDKTSTLTSAEGHTSSHLSVRGH